MMGVRLLDVEVTWADVQIHNKPLSHPLVIMSQQSPQQWLLHQVREPHYRAVPILALFWLSF
jgi:hypothetical protein